MTYTAFDGPRRIMSGPLPQVAIFLKDAPQRADLLVFDDATGSQVDLDTRGTPEEISIRYSEQAPAEPRGRGRPRLGVVAREVTLRSEERRVGKECRSRWTPE